MATYLINGGLMDSMASSVRRITNTQSLYNGAEIAETLSKVNGAIVETNEQHQIEALDLDYFIDEELLASMATQIRRIANTEESYNAAQMAEIMAKISGTVEEPEGAYHIQAVDCYGRLSKSSYFNSGATFVCPSNISLPDGYVLKGWQCKEVVTPNNYIVVENNDVTMHPIIDTASGATEITTFSVGYLNLPPFTDKVSVDWGDGTINNATYHSYNDTGTYLVKIYGATNISRSSGVRIDGCKDIKFSKDMQNIGDHALYRSTLNSVVIPNTVSNIGTGAFYGCQNLKTLEIPSSVINIGDYAFYNCRSLTSIEIPDSVTSIGYSAFRECSSLTSIEIPDSVTNIGDGAFMQTKLTSVKIPNGLKTISKNMFVACYTLTRVEIPSSVTIIDGQAFLNCSNLKTIIYKGTKSEWQKIFFNGNWNGGTGNYTVYCTDGNIAKS